MFDLVTLSRAESDGGGGAVGGELHRARMEWGPLPKTPTRRYGAAAQAAHSLALMAATHSAGVVMVSASSSGISMSNASSMAMISSTASRLSAPRSSVKLESGCTLPTSTPSCSAIMPLTLSSTSSAIMRTGEYEADTALRLTADTGAWKASAEPKRATAAQTASL